MHTAIAANKRPAASASHTQDVPPIAQLPQPDQTLLRELSAKVAGATSAAYEGSNPKEDAFYAGVAELHAYILALRADLDVGFNEPDPSNPDNSWAKAEPTRPSVKRVQHLAYNFFDLPGIKRVSLGIHAQKLVAALPHFCGVIAGSIPVRNTLAEHFSGVIRLMASSLLASLDEARLDQYREVGMIMGYRTAGMRWPVDPALRHFAGQGVETFVEQLERVVRSAIKDRVDPFERVTAELLEKEGTIYRLMRVSFDRVNDAVRDITGKSIGDARRILAENDYSTGACPGLVPVDSVAEYGATSKRPIAYEYATAILKTIPPQLLQPA